MLLFCLLALAGTASAENLNTDRLPPKVLYHMGQKKHLLDDAEHGIPDDVWKDSIMGRGNRFGLVPYRRGLYGGKNFDTLELYSNTYLGSPQGKAKEPWVMRIVIKDECLKPEAVSDLATDDKYLDWLMANVTFLTKDVSFCLNLTTKTCDNLIIGMQPIAGGQEENICDDVMEKFMKEANPRVVRDTEWDSSWYLRDRACIERLEASPQAVLEMLAEAKWDWESRKSTYKDSSAEKKNGYGMSTVAMLVGALKDSSSVDPSLLKKLRNVVAHSDIRFGLAAEGRPWVAETAPSVIDAYSRCLAADKRNAFQSAANAFGAQLNDPRIGDWEFQEKTASSLLKSMKSICL